MDARYFIVKSGISIWVIVKQSGTFQAGSTSFLLSSPVLIFFPIEKSFVKCIIRSETTFPLMLTPESLSTSSLSSVLTSAQVFLPSFALPVAALPIVALSIVASSSNFGAYNLKSPSKSLLFTISSFLLIIVFQCSIIYEISVVIQFWLFYLQ